MNKDPNIKSIRTVVNADSPTGQEIIQNALVNAIMTEEADRVDGFAIDQNKLDLYVATIDLLTEMKANGKIIDFEATDPTENYDLHTIHIQWKTIKQGSSDTIMMDSTEMETLSNIIKNMDGLLIETQFPTEWQLTIENIYAKL